MADYKQRNQGIENKDFRYPGLNEYEGKEQYDQVHGEYGAGQKFY